MRVAVIGMGYVGNACSELLGKKYNVTKKDLGGDYKEVNLCDVSIVSVPTPETNDGSCDISIVESVVSDIETPLIIIKSTVPPGTTRMLADKYNKRIVFSPEYIGEGNYPIPYWEGMPHPTDMTLHGFMIFGGDKDDTKKCVNIFSPVLGPFCRFAQTDSTTAELVKYMVNSYLSTKVTFVNEFYNIAYTFGIDFNELRELWLMDGRIGRAHTAVFPDNRGFDGKCLPKDTNGIVNACIKAGYFPRFLNDVLGANNEFRDGM